MLQDFQDRSSVPANRMDLHNTLRRLDYTKQYRSTPSNTGQYHSSPVQHRTIAGHTRHTPSNTGHHRFNTFKIGQYRSSARSYALQKSRPARSKRRMRESVSATSPDITRHTPAIPDNTGHTPDIRDNTRHHPAPSTQHRALQVHTPSYTLNAFQYASGDFNARTPTQ